MVIELGDNLTRILIHLIDGTAIVCGVYLFGRGMAYYLSPCEDWNCNTFSKFPYFKSQEIAEQFIEEFGNEIIEVLCNKKGIR